MAKSDDKNESETRMKVSMARKHGRMGTKGCCVDDKGRAYCQWLLHGHAFCNNGCTWEAVE
jgi:hypothetical protein